MRTRVLHCLVYLSLSHERRTRGTVTKKTQKKAVAEVDYNTPKKLATKAGKTAGEEAVGVTLKLRATKRQTMRR